MQQYIKKKCNNVSLLNDVNDKRCKDDRKKKGGKKSEQSSSIVNR